MNNFQMTFNDAMQKHMEMDVSRQVQTVQYPNVQ